MLLARQFKIGPGERLPAAAAALLFILTNSITVARFWNDLSAISGNYGWLLRKFRVSGFDPLTYSVVNDWSAAYNVYRHPFLAFFMYPAHLLKEALLWLTGVNLTLPIVGAMVALAATYSFVFLRRILLRIVGLGPKESTALSFLLYSMGYVMLSCMVPDHFVFSMALLLLGLLVAGERMSAGKGFGKWETIWLFLLTAGVSLNNGVKVFMAALATRGRRFFSPWFLAVAVLLPSAGIWAFARWEYKTYSWPREMQNKRNKAAKAAENRKKAYAAFMDTVKTRDKDAAKAQFEDMMARKAAKKKEADKKRLVWKNAGKPISKKEFWNWTDTTTPRGATALHNLFGEGVQLHQDYLLADALVNRPVFVHYRWAWSYAVEAIVALLFAAGIAMGRREPFMWLCLSYAAFDLFIHFILGFAINEIYIMSAHWMFSIPIAIGYLVRALGGRWRKAAVWSAAALACYLYAYNGALVAQYYFS